MSNAQDRVDKATEQQRRDIQKNNEAYARKVAAQREARNKAANKSRGKKR
jgi:hypothetical protein